MLLLRFVVVRDDSDPLMSWVADTEPPRSHGSPASSADARTPNARQPALFGVGRAKLKQRSRAARG